MFDDKNALTTPADIVHSRKLDLIAVVKEDSHA